VHRDVKADADVNSCHVFRHFVVGGFDHATDGEFQRTEGDVIGRKSKNLLCRNVLRDLSGPEHRLLHMTVFRVSP
jgi:hypothetical protein